MIQRLNPIQATMLITILGVFASITLTFISFRVIYGTGVMPLGVILSILLPLILTPSVGYAFFRLLAALQQAQREKEAVIDDLQQALDNIRRLSGLLPICASCKKIRDDQGYWHQVEDYIGTHAEVDFSHGICPECIKQLYSGVRHTSGRNTTSSGVEAQS